MPTPSARRGAPAPRPAARAADAPRGAYARLRTLVVRGRLAPGARVTEGDVAATLGVSRTPVREAFRRLLLEGLLVPDGGGKRPRVAVAPLSAAEAREVYRAVGALEAMAAREVEAHTPAACAALASDLRRLDDAFRRAAAEPRPSADRLFELHHAFHVRLQQACAGPVVRALLDALTPRLERYEWFHAPLVRRAGDTFAATHVEHDAIVAAAAAGDGAALERAVRTNWSNAAERLASALDAAAAASGAPRSLSATTRSPARRSPSARS
jgi:DNA-binding GntR family transcriptional regulator